MPSGGALIRRKWFRTYTATPSRESGDQIVQSWDTAAKADNRNDFSVCTTWLKRKSDLYLLDVQRKRLEFPDLRRFAIKHAKAFKASSILIEDASTGQSLIQELRNEGLRPIAIKPDRDKVVRLEAQSAKIEAGHVLLPRTAPWLDDFLLEILAFPYGRFDDQVDSVSQFLAWATKRRVRIHISSI